MAIKLGSKVQDTVTGFKGIASSRVEFMYGCARIFIEPEKCKDGKPVEGQYFDEQRVELVKEQAPTVSRASSAGNGGPQPNDPRSRKMPRR